MLVLLESTDHIDTQRDALGSAMEIALENGYEVVVRPLGREVDSGTNPKGAESLRFERNRPVVSTK